MEKNLLTKFDVERNIAYFDENLDVPGDELIFKHYISSSLIYSFFALVILYNPFYAGILKNELWIQYFMLFLLFSYFVFALPAFSIFRPKTLYVSHSVQVLNYLKRLFDIKNYSKTMSAKEFISTVSPKYKERQSIILYLIKLFFAPQLLLWAYQHFSSAFIQLISIKNSALALIALNTPITNEIMAKGLIMVYPFLITSLYFIDCIIFAIGYCSELNFMKNRIKTVEDSFLGIFFCIICYPPFNKITATFIKWEHSEFDLSGLDLYGYKIWIYCALVLFFVFIYVSASVALGTKASNLTNRGIVSKFPYNIIRHPAYLSKITFWWVSSLIPIKIFVQNGCFSSAIFYVLGAMCWSFIYFMRAMTEERHLSYDPDYIEYTKRVKWRFIPKVF